MRSRAVLSLAVAAAAFGARHEEAGSLSLNNKSQEQVQLKVLPKVDNARLLAEDRTRGEGPRHLAPVRFAVAVDVA